MVREWLVSITSTSYPAVAQVIVPPGVTMDSFSVINASLSDIALAFDIVRKDSSGTAIDDLTVSTTGPGQAFTIPTRSQRIYIRAKSSVSAFTVQINASKEK